AWNKCLSNFPALLRANGNVLQVWIIGRQPAGRGARLAESRVNASALEPDRGGQGIDVSGFEFRRRTVIQNFLHDRVRTREFLEELFVRRVLTPFGLFCVLQKF